MSRYYNDINYHQKNHNRYRRRARQIKKIFIGILVVGGLVIFSVGVDFIWETVKQDGQRTTTTPTNSYYSAPLKVFRTPYFQFQTDDSWSEAVSESRQNVYVYRKLRQHFVEHELFVYVNTPLTDITATRVLPVNATSTGELLPLKVSGHCAETYKPQESRLIKTVSIQDVSFSCDPNDSTYKVIVGLLGGGVEMKLKRPDNTEATYTIIYRNITAMPEGSQLEHIAESFQAR